MALSKEQIQGAVEGALEMSGMIGNPASLNPSDMGLYEGRPWDSEDALTLLQVLAALYGPASLSVQIRQALDFVVNPDAHQAPADLGDFWRADAMMFEFTTDTPDVSVYVQSADVPGMADIMIGAPGWDPNAEVEPTN